MLATWTLMIHGQHLKASFVATALCKTIATLVSLIIVQDGINVQADKIQKINKRAGWNKAVQVGIFHFLLVKIKVLA